MRIFYETLKCGSVCVCVTIDKAAWQDDKNIGDEIVSIGAESLAWLKFLGSACYAS